MSFQTAQKQLAIHKSQRGIRYDLGPIEEAAACIDSPQLKLPYCFHVAGTNGKGSTVTFLAAFLTQQGLKVGTYTSPHITSYEERIQINLEKIPSDIFEQIYQSVFEKTADFELTEFEHLTLVAFEYFSHQKLDAVVIETGLGGRLDATNIVPSQQSIITSVGMDHMAILGPSIKDIAKEKAGIIKTNQTVITPYCQADEVFPALKEASEKQNSTVILSHAIRHKNLSPYQQINAGLVYSTLLHSPFKNFLTGPNSFAEFCSKHLPWGRFTEIHRGTQNIMIDGAHNPLGWKALAQALKDKYPNQKMSFLFGLGQGKEPKELAPLLDLETENIYYCEFNKEVALPAAQFVASLAHLEIKPYHLGNALPKEVRLVITGSLYFLGAMKTVLNNS